MATSVRTLARLLVLVALGAGAWLLLAVRRGGDWVGEPAVRTAAAPGAVGLEGHEKGVGQGPTLSRTGRDVRVARRSPSAEQSLALLHELGIALEGTTQPPPEYRGSIARWRIRYTQPLASSQVVGLLRNVARLQPGERDSLFVRIKLSTDDEIRQALVDELERLPASQGALRGAGSALELWVSRPAPPSPEGRKAARSQRDFVDPLIRLAVRLVALPDHPTPAVNWRLASHYIQRSAQALGGRLPASDDALRPLRAHVAAAIQAASDGSATYALGDGPFLIGAVIGGEDVVEAMLAMLGRWDSIPADRLAFRNLRATGGVDLLELIAKAVQAHGAGGAVQQMAIVLLRTPKPRDPEAARALDQLFVNVSERHDLPGEVRRELRARAGRHDREHR